MPTNAEFLAPVLALVAWTLVMWIWMYATRIPAMKEAGIDPQEAAYPGTWVHRLRPGVRSVADNYNHLMEQPTLFYAIAITLALIDPDGVNRALAWSYVGLRVVHSLLQALVNKILHAPIKHLRSSAGSPRAAETAAAALHLFDLGPSGGAFHAGSN